MTEEQEEQLLDLLEAGTPWRAALKELGFQRGSLRQWQRENYERILQRLADRKEDG